MLIADLDHAHKKHHYFFPVAELKLKFVFKLDEGDVNNNSKDFKSKIIQLATLVEGEL